MSSTRRMQKAPAGRLLLAAGLVLWASSAQAQGFDLTGAWTGKARCSAFDGVPLSMPSSEAILYVVQNGTSISARFTDGSTTKEFNGFAVAQINRPNMRAVLVECRSGTALDGFSEFVHLKATSRAISRMRARTIFRSQNGDVGECRWSFKRTSETAPVLDGCG